MVVEIIRAILIGALPVALCTFAVLQWSISSGRMKRFDGSADLWRQHQDNARAARKKREDVPSGFLADMFHHRIISFGGGYYGTMAVITYVLIESMEIWNFITGMVAVDTWINHPSLGLLIEFFINSIMNIVAAFTWFITLPGIVTIENGMVWLVATYAGYLAGLKLAAESGDVIMEKIRDLHRGSRKGDR